MRGVEGPKAHLLSSPLACGKLQAKGMMLPEGTPSRPDGKGLEAEGPLRLACGCSKPCRPDKAALGSLPGRPGTYLLACLHAYWNGV